MSNNDELFESMIFVVGFVFYDGFVGGWGVLKVVVDVVCE